MTNTMTDLLTILPLQASQGDDAGMILALIVFPIWVYFVIYKPIKDKIEDIRISSQLKREKKLKPKEERKQRNDGNVTIS